MPREDFAAECKRACARGAVLGLVLAAHAALWIAIVMPAAPSPPQARAARPLAGVLQVELLPPPRLSRSHVRQPVPRPAAVPRLQPPQRRTLPATPDLQVTLAPPSPAATAQPPAAFIEGGRFGEHLREAETSRGNPRLPGGHHYLASDLSFVAVERQSIEGRVHAVAGVVFGWQDMTCRNLQYEAAKPRSQQIADGFTRDELQRRLREHGCG